MDTVDAIVKGIESDPDELTAVYPLIDALMEFRDMTRSEAERHAEHVVQTARDARDLATAADLLTDDKPWRADLVRDILNQVMLDEGTRASIIVVPGDTRPLHGTQRHAFGGGWWTEHTVTVGALWVVRYWRSNASLCLKPIPKKGRKGRTQ